MAPRRNTQEEIKKAPVPTRNYTAVPEPLAINGAPRHSEEQAPIHRKQVGSESHTPRAIAPPVMTGDKSPPKNVAFMFPPEVEEVRSICQSPSWEAYDRRKKEKAEVKREKKDERKAKEQAAQEKPRGRRLTKASPLTPYVPTMTMGDRSMSSIEIPVRQIQPKPRPSSVLGIPLHRQPTEEQKKEKPEKVEKPEKAEKPEKKRRRSSSLTSLIRSSFEIRRPSIDRDTGFIGGVKLEQKKQDFHQQVLEDQAQGNSKVHPAFRKSFIGHGSFTPLKVPPPQKPERESKRRGCPPISIQAAAARNPGLLTPTSPSPSKPDFTNIYLWSARANRGAQSDDECAIVDDSEVEDPREKRSPVEQGDNHKGKGGLARSGGIYVRSTPPPDYNRTSSSGTSGSERSGHSDDRENSNKLENSKQTQPPKPQSPKKTNPSRPPVTAAPKTSRSRTGSFSSLFSTSTAPEPPRKSSKRNSLVFLSRLQSSSQDDSDNSEDVLKSLKDPYTPPNLDLKRPSEEKPNLKLIPPSRQKSDNMVHSSPPSIPYERTSAGAKPKMYTSETWSPSNPRWNLKDAVNAAFRRGSSSQSSLASPMTSSHLHMNEGAFVSSPKSIDRDRSPVIDDRRSQPASSTSSIPSATIRIAGERMEPLAPPSLGSWRPDTSSSEYDSNSDAMPTVSPMSTPHTTPPQSEMDYPHSGATIRKVNNKHKRNSKSWSATDSPHLLTNARYEPSIISSESSGGEFDPIQAAARKVMEAFPKASTHQNGSRTDYRLDTDFQSKAPYPPLQLRDKSFNSPMSPQSPSTPLSPQSPRVVLSKGHKSSRSTSEIPSKSIYQQPNSTSNPNSGEPVGKMFVECCSCKYYHDMPSKLYEAMVDPHTALSSTENVGFVGTISMTVKCPWCKHEMSTRCCAGLVAMVYIKERLH